MSNMLAWICVAATAALCAAVPTVELHNAAAPGQTIPVFGIGTGGYGNASGYGGEHWNDTIAEAAVSKYLSAGGRRIDTSLQYYTQTGCGNAWTQSGIPRSEIFITTKCDSPAYGMVPGGYNETVASVKLSLQQLQTTYLDLVLIHWPGTPIPPSNPPPCWSAPNNWTLCRSETWRALEDIYRSGVARAIGVSNYEINHLQEIIDMGSLLPAVNQFEYHPYWHTDDLVAFLKEHSIVPNSYAPLGTPDHMAFFPDDMPVLLPSHPVVKSIATRAGCTPTQVLQRWAISNGFVVNPRSESLEHMIQNLDTFECTLTASEIQSLFHIDNPPIHVCGDPHLIP